MDVPRATSALRKSRFSRFCWVDETGSTNADLLELAHDGAPEQVVGADFQHAGRGRLGRTWESDPGAGVLCSLLVRPAATLADPHLITTALGLAAAEAVDEVCQVRLGIKWPNDLVAGTAESPDDRKVAGVLAESVLDGGRVAAVVVGIGLNVDRRSDGGPSASPAASIRELAGREVDRTDLVIAMVERFAERLGQVESPSGAPEVRRAVAARSATLGRQVRVERPGDELVGRAVDLTAAGHLVVEADGDRHEIAVGDVIHLRPLG